MKITRPGFRVLSVVLLIALALSLATPGRAEAIEPLTIITIASLAAVAVIIVVYLVVANMHESEQNSSGAAARYVACVESDLEPRACWAVPSAPDPVPVRAAALETPQGQ